MVTLTPGHQVGSFDKGGWGGAIANRLVRRCDLLNRGLSGYNTKWALNVLPKIITQPTNQATIAAVAVFFGANDSTLKDVNPVQHIPLTEYTENLKRIIQYLKSIGVCEEKVIMITPPPLDESAWEKACITKGGKLDRCNSVTKQYAEACVKVATEYGTDVLDLWTLMQMENRVIHCARGKGVLASSTLYAVNYRCLLYVGGGMAWRSCIPSHGEKVATGFTPSAAALVEELSRSCPCCHWERQVMTRK
ncbi:isoamyl acetate-hydrolyzing esterase 1 homolog isoform X2 [Heterodontus francisci]|uniref:isoamyl acetate-hydrolyzing esterase 1 homolog isoform X2 n=1 Tax=Heterodontus francisci TaxID=7792 RepID=UPI00355B36F7